MTSCLFVHLCGEVPHELVDWWTAFEEAPADERKDMLQDLKHGKPAAVPVKDK